MKRFVFGVDLDGVCGDYLYSLRNYMAGTGNPLPEVEATSWDLVKAGLFPDRESYNQAHKDAVLNGIFTSMPELSGVSDALWKLSDHEIHIRVVTHRLGANGDHGFAVQDTVRWLQAPRPDGRPRIPFRDLCFLGTKEAIASDLHIDDAPHVIEAMKAAGHEVLIFDAPYNRHLEGSRANSWEEVVEYVLAFRQQLSEG